jgi:hypothetical protein
MGVCAMSSVWYWHPPVGVYLFVLLEIKSIYQDRNEHDREQVKARNEQLTNFGTIANGINASIAASQAQFQTTMDRLQTAVKSSEEASRNTAPHALITSLAMSPSGQVRPASAVIFPNQAFEINVVFRKGDKCRVRFPVIFGQTRRRCITERLSFDFQQMVES